MDTADGINRAGRLWLFGNNATLCAVGRAGYAVCGRGCVVVRLAPSGRPLDEPVFRSVAEIAGDDRAAEAVADAAATYDPERLTLVLVEQARLSTREFLLLGADGTTLEGIEAARTRCVGWFDSSRHLNIGSRRSLIGVVEPAQHRDSAYRPPRCRTRHAWRFLAWGSRCCRPWCGRAVLK